MARMRRLSIAATVLGLVMFSAVGCSTGSDELPAGGSAGTPAFPAPTAGTTASAAGTGVGAAGTAGAAGTTAGALASVDASVDAATGPTSCALDASRLRVTQVDVGRNIASNEDEAALAPIVLAPLPSVGARVAFMGDDEKLHVITLDGDDKLGGTEVSFAAHDLSAMHADDGGGVLLLTRDAQGGGTLNCGAPTNLCGTPPSPAIACHDMYLVRFDGPAESWATKLTSSSANLPPYSTSKTGERVYMIWWYAHHGRIAYDGARYAAYFGTAISVSEGGCVNIHQGDRMQVVDKSGALVSGGFELGCSHSGYERILWDATAQKFVSVCKTDNQNRIAIAPDYTTIRPVDLAYANLGNLVQGSGGGYWLTTSDARSGQPAGADGLAALHLLHFTSGAADRDLVIETDATQNARAPHLSAYGAAHMLAAWETSPSPGELAPNDGARTLHLQVRDRSTGEPDGAAITSDVRGNRYQDFVAFPDGSVAYAAPGDSASQLKILRVLPCAAQ
jgi:hypothetical protein